MILLIIYLGSIMLAGAGLSKLLCLHSSNDSPAFKAASSFALGCGIVPLILFYLNLIHVPVTLPTVAILCAVLSSPAIVGYLKRMKKPAEPDSAQQKLTRQQIALAALTALLLGMALLKAPSSPMRYFDERAKWSFKAKIIYHEGSPMGESFTDNRRINIDRRYPLGVPYLMAGGHMWMGGFDESAVKLIFPVIFALIVIGVISKVKGRAGFMAGAYIAAMPFFHYSHILEGGSSDTAYADVPFACYYLFSALYLLRWFKKKQPSDLRGYALFMAAILFTKQEGLILYASATFVSIFHIMRSKDIKFSPIFAYFLLPVVLIAPFYIWAFSLPKGGIDYMGSLSFDVLIQNLERIPDILYWFLLSASSSRWIFLLPMVILAAVLLKPEGKPENGFLPLLFLLILLPMFGYVFLVTITPSDYLWQLEVATNRLIMHVAPLAVLFIGMRMKS